MECAICLEEKHHFKVLQCEHAFCDNCIEDIASGKLTAANETNNLKQPSENVSNPEVEGESKELPKIIECPKCRHVTSLENGHWTKLPSKYFGNLRCCQCDEHKSVEEFRWCRVCSVSVCSRCYIDKHVNTSEDGKILGLHAATKWDSDYPAVKFCLEQLLREIENGRETAHKAKEYVRSYLEGLQEYMCVEIDQKTKSCENDFRQVMANLSDAYGIDLSAVKPAANLNRSYQYMINPLYHLTGGNTSSPELHKQKYKINSVPYKDLARHLLGTEKVSALSAIGSDLFFDPSCVSRKLAGESVVIGCNVIKQPSDMCLLPIMADTKIVVITDYELGVFLFKCQTMQLQGPLPLRQPYARFGRVAPVGGAEKQSQFGDASLGAACPTSVKVMVTCQVAPNGPWTCIVLDIAADKQEHIRINNHNNHNHFGLPRNENLHLMSSHRSLLGLSTNSAQTLWRFSGLEDTSWKELHTVAPQGNPKPYCRLGPVRDYSDHTEVLLTNGPWQTVDIIKFGWPSDKLWSVKRVELATLLIGPTAETQFSEPALFPCYGSETDPAIIVDKKQPFVYMIDRNARRSLQLARFSAKLPKRVVFVGANAVLLLVQNKDNQQTRSLQLYA